VAPDAAVALGNEGMTALRKAVANLQARAHWLTMEHLGANDLWALAGDPDDFGYIREGYV
jgi:hypothetical protein